MISRIAKYPVENELGRGGMGRVYRAFDPDVNRPVAIKVLEAESDPELLRRFRAEIDTTGSLQHKNIVTLYECGEDSGVPYLVMELLPGQTLEAVIKKPVPLTLLDKVRIMTQVAQGLSYAHSKGVIHRDVKPGNIMLLPDGSVKIMDFGIARVMNRKTVMTQEGFIFGTIPYMAPEQFEPGGKADKQTDIFSYADVYYELLTGTQPFAAPDIYATIRRIKTYEPEAVSQLVPGCPETLELLVHRAMAKDREVRYGSFAELLLDSEAVLVDLQHERAVQILEETGPLIEAGGLESAVAKLEQALELEPGNREARELWRTVRKRIDEEKFTKRIAVLISESEAQIEKRQFAEAVQTLEKALGLKKNDPEVHRRLVAANARLNAHLRANKLVAEARRDRQKDELPHSLQRLREALDFDPQHTDARILIRRVETELERRREEERIQQAIGMASEHRVQKRYDEALAALQELQSSEASVRVAELRAEIEREKTEAERRKRADRFRVGVSKVREALQSQDLSKAGQQIEFLEAQFMDEPGARELLRQLRAELDAQFRADAISGYSKGVRELSGQKRLPEALNVLQDALERFPEDPGLVRLRQETEAKYAAMQRAEAIAAVLKQVYELRDAGLVRAALDALAQGRKRIGEDPAFSDPARELEAELEQQRHALGLQQLLERVRELTGGERYEEAIAAIEAAREYRDESEVAASLASARSALAMQRERGVVDAALERASGLEREQSHERALESLEEALRVYPHSPALSQATYALKDRIARKQRHARIAEERARIERDITAGEWKRAEGAVGRAQRDFPGEPVFDQLAEQVKRALFDAGLEQIAEQVRQMLAMNQLADVSEQINRTRTIYAGDPRWTSLEQEVGKRHAYEAGLAEAAGFHKRGEFEKAEARLTALVREGAPDDRAARMLEEARYEWGLREADGFRTRGEFKQAEQRLGALAASGVADDRAVRMLEEVRYESGLREAESFRKRGQPDKAEARLTGLVQNASDDRATRMLADVRYEAGLADADALRKRGELDQAEARLSGLARNGSPDGRAARMLEEVRGRRLAVTEERERDLARVAASVRERLQRDEVAAAESELAAARAEYPDERTRFDTLRAEIDRRKAFLDTLQRAGQEHQRGKYDEANRILATLNPAERADQARVLALGEAVTSDKSRKTRIEALENAKRRLEKLKRARDPAALLAFLKEVRQQFPEETAFRHEYEQAVAEAGRNTASQTAPAGAIVEPKLELQAVTGPASSKARLIGAAAGLLAVAAGALYWFEMRPPAQMKQPAAQTAELRLTSEPPGASVTLNNQTCTTPCELKMPAGSYALNARLDNYEPFTQEVVIGDREVRNGYNVKVPLKPVTPPPPPSRPALAGSIEIAVNQDDVAVLVNGQAYGFATTRKPVTASLEAGEYSIHVEKPNYTSASRKVRIEAGQNKRLAFVLNSLPGRVVISRALPATQVAVDGVLKGRVPESGTLSLEINPGPHRLRLSHDGYSPREEPVEVGPNQTVPLGPGRVGLTKIGPSTPDWPEIARQALLSLPNDADRLEEFAARYKGTPAANEALQRSGQLRAKARSDQIAKDQAAKEQAAKEQAARDQDARAQALRDQLARDHAEREKLVAAQQQTHAILAVVDRFNAAFQHHKLKELKQVWLQPRDPFPAWVERGAALVTLHPTGQVEVKGDTASIDCDLITAKTVPVRVVLQKNDNRWSIIDIAGR